MLSTKIGLYYRGYFFQIVRKHHRVCYSVFVFRWVEGEIPIRAVRLLVGDTASREKTRFTFTRHLGPATASLPPTPRTRNSPNKTGGAEVEGKRTHRVRLEKYAASCRPPTPQPPPPPGGRVRTARARSRRFNRVVVVRAAVCDMQPATKPPRASAVLKLGRYVLRCLTAQPDIWFLFLYKCGQLVAVNLHEPVARSVGLLDELFQESHADRGPAVGPQPSAGGRRASVDQAARGPSPPPDNDQYRGMDGDDDTEDDGYTDWTGAATDEEDDEDEDPYAFLTQYPFASSPCGSSGRRSSSGFGRGSRDHSRRGSAARGHHCGADDAGSGVAAAREGTYGARMIHTFLASSPASCTRTLGSVLVVCYHVMIFTRIPLSRGGDGRPNDRTNNNTVKRFGVFLVSLEPPLIKRSRAVFETTRY